MSSETAAVLSQIDEVLARCEATPTDLPTWRRYDDKGSAWIAERSTSCVALIQRLVPRGSAYWVAADEPFNDGQGSGNSLTLPHLVGVVAALRADVEAGYLRSLAELVHADVFADFLEMADELLAKRFKDPAAVMAGSVLEEHLRKLAAKHGTAPEDQAGRPKKAEILNATLAKDGVYNKLDQKNVTAWLGLRNEAAHGHYERYDDQQVGALIRDVRSFMSRYTA